MYVIASLCILFSSANIFLISSVIFVISNSPFHFYYVVAFYTFSRDFRCLGRDFRTAEFVFSTHFAYFPLFRQRFPAGGAWFLYPFRRFSLFWVEISGRRGLVSLPISPGFPVLGRDFRQAGLGFSTHFAGFPCFRQRFPAGGAWFLYLFPAKTAVQVEIPGITPHHDAPPRRTPTARPTACPTTARPTTAHPTTARPATASHPHSAPHYDIVPHHGTLHHSTTRYGITHRYDDTSHCSFSTHFIVIIIFYKGNN